MPNKLRYCILCKRYDGRAKRSSYTRINNVERETKLREGYRLRYNGQEFDQPLLNQLVHQKCYNKIVQCVSESISSNDILTSIEQHQDDNDEEQDQTSLLQSRSCISIPRNVKRFLERRQRVCIVCNSYKYSSKDRMKQVASNFIANKLAEGFLYRYKRPFGKSLLDAYIHDGCYKKLYGSYRNHPSRRCRNKNYLQHQQLCTSQSLESPHETRSRSNINTSSLKSKQLVSEITTDETTNLSIEKLFSTPLSMSIPTTNSNVELSARSCLFLPCMQRLTPEEIEFYTKRNTISEKIHEDNNLISDQLPFVQSSIIQTLTTNDSMIYSNEDNNANDINTNEQDQSSSSSHPLFSKQQKIRPAAEIRHRYSRPPPLAKPTNPLIYDHIYTPKPPVQIPHDDLENLYHWLIKELKSSSNPIPMSEVLTKYRELAEEDIDTTAREDICRVRLKNRLEKFYPNQFVFVVPNKRDGTFIALNDVDYYVRIAIKNAQREKEKTTEASILSSVIIPSTTKDYKRETCETIMNGIRKIRLYIRDPKQINSSPSLLMQNVIGLITTSEKQFEKISHQYDFYRMIDENLFDNGNQIKSHKYDKSLRNMSLASDLISARHDNQISQKHFLLADEFAKETFRSTPTQIITLLNHYGHTCSYKSYRKIKTLRQRMINEFGENFITDQDKSSDSELDLIEL